MMLPLILLGRATEKGSHDCVDPLMPRSSADQADDLTSRLNRA